MRPAPTRSIDTVRLTFRLGPWASPRDRGWTSAYDGLVERLVEAGVSILGVLDEDLALGDLSSPEWRAAFAANAAAVIVHYADRLPTFELLPAANRPDAFGDQRHAPESVAEILASVYLAVKQDPRARDTVLVLGGIAVSENGPAYLARLLEAGRNSATWQSVRQHTHAPAPFDAVAAWLALPEPPEAVLTGHFAAQVEAIQRALAQAPGLADIPIYISGLTWSGRGDLISDSELELALSALVATTPRLRLAVRDTTLMGPVPPATTTGEVSLVGPFAVFTPAELPRHMLVQRAPIRVADGFDWPVGPRGTVQPAPGFFSATSLVDQDYFRTFNAWHTGEDWNGPGGCDSDLGFPIFAVANGVVVAAGFFQPSWGNILLIEHTLPNGAHIWTQYAHLLQVLPALGDTVERGQQIGTMGKGANDRWCAHLHFEIRNCELTPDNWFPFVSSRDRVLECYQHPTRFLRAHRPGMFPVQGITVDSEPPDQESGEFVRSDTPHWRQSLFGWNGTSLYTFASKFETEFGIWRPRLPQSGPYKVEVWIPGFHATTRNAVYTVQHAAGKTEVSVDQSLHFDVWVSLGVFDFESGKAAVRLTDKTGEMDSARFEICFDAVRWLPA